MSAPYSPKAIANAFLQKAFNDKKLFGHLKLQKLVYLAHGYYLTLSKGTPLVDEPFEAWDYGPVCRSLYLEFREFGRERITRLASEFDWDIGVEVPAAAPADDQSVSKVIDFVYRNYADKSPFELSELTHKSDWAWDRTRKADKFGLKNKDIENEWIKEDFEPYLKKKAA
jgi:uncharacterized phage-associated protein